jgi:nitrite reductase (NADH) small subunit
MMVQVCEAAALQPGRGIAVKAGGKTLALFFVDGRVFAAHDLCPHAGAPLSEGGAYLEGGVPVVVCPSHYWMFSLEDGRCPYHKDMQARVFAAELRDGAVWVDLPGEPTGST